MTPKKHPLLQFFAYSHLSQNLQTVSQPFGVVAEKISSMTDEEIKEEADKISNCQFDSLLTALQSNMDSLPYNIESTTSIYKISEAKTFLLGSFLYGKTKECILDGVLRRLLESKDCAVRSIIFKDDF